MASVGLPEGWKKFIDQSTGQPYYQGPSGEVTWTAPPAPAPPPLAPPPPPVGKPILPPPPVVGHDLLDKDIGRVQAQLADTHPIINAQARNEAMQIAGTDDIAKAIVKIVDDILRLHPTEKEMPDHKRAQVLHCLVLILREPQAYYLFNTVPFAPMPGVYTPRVMRLRILADHENECLNEDTSRDWGRQCLNLLGYKCLLFEKMLSHEPNCCYTLILDQSGSMGSTCGGADYGSRWDVAEKSADHIVEAILGKGAYEPRAGVVARGVDIWLFNNKATLFPDVRDECCDIFDQNRPGGGTDLSLALQRMFDRHFDCRSGIMENVFIITDGCPNSKPAVQSTIIRNVNRLGNELEMALTFIQIGDDENAAEYICEELHDVCENPGVKFNIVDVLTMEDTEGMPFLGFLQYFIPESGLLPATPIRIPAPKITRSTQNGRSAHNARVQQKHGGKGCDGCSLM